MSGRVDFARRGRRVAAFAVLLSGVAAAQQPADWVPGLRRGGVTAETARRRLVVAEPFPVASVTALLRDADPAVVVRAAELLAARGVALDALRALLTADDARVRAAALPAATDEALGQFLVDRRVPELQRAALYALQDRGVLTDAQLASAIGDAELRDAATRLMVYERSPFPIELADRQLRTVKAQRVLLECLAERPRARAAVWLQRALDGNALAPRERLMAIEALPPESISLRLAREVLQSVPDLPTSAARVAARFPPILADRLVADVVKRMCEAPGRRNEFLACLERISPAGEQTLWDLVLEALRGKATAGEAARAMCYEVAHWLSVRESPLVPRFLAAALDAAAPFPPELAVLAAGSLTTPARIQKLVAVLGEADALAVHAFDALLDAGVYHPAMAKFVADSAPVDRTRRTWHLLQLPPEKLPDSLMLSLLRGEDVDGVLHALKALTRAPLSKVVDNAVLDLALHNPLDRVRLAASRTAILQGSESAGRQTWAKLPDEGLVVDWLVRRPKPWQYDQLLRVRASVHKERPPHSATLHQVLIALAKLGDRGAVEELRRELRTVGAERIRHVLPLLARSYGKAELERLAAEHLQVAELARGEAVRISSTPADEGRGELLEWVIQRKELDIVPLLYRLWKNDAVYEIRLIALRGLLARQSERAFHDLGELLRRPYDERLQEMAFEVVGSMTHPIGERAMELLARILLEAPLTDPQREIRLALAHGDRTRNDYPLATPAANLLRRDAAARPRAAFARVAGQLGGKRFALNRRRFGTLLTTIQRGPELAADLGPVLAELILLAPDRDPTFVGPAERVLARRAEQGSRFAEAARRWDVAHRAFCRGTVPPVIARAFLGNADPRAGYHPFAFLAARGPLCRARDLVAKGEAAAARRELDRARDLAEGDESTLREIATLRKT
ncbi:MAG: hypothetical protein KDC87_21205, partial [Planctomycetes bacterium]|nr:hypothetical protein [Planctomycetota bacterium]